MLKTGWELRLCKKKICTAFEDVQLWSAESRIHRTPWTSLQGLSKKRASSFWQKLRRAVVFDLPDNCKGVIMKMYTQNIENILATSKHLLKGKYILINVSMSKLSLKPQVFIWNKFHLEKNMLLPNSLCREKQKKKTNHHNKTHNQKETLVLCCQIE